MYAIRSYYGFYGLAKDYGLKYAIGQASNEVLKQRTARVANAVDKLFVSQNVKHQHFMAHQYQAKTWQEPQHCYSKIESTGKGLNIRHFISNMDEGDRSGRITSYNVCYTKLLRLRFDAE